MPIRVRRAAGLTALGTSLGAWLFGSGPEAYAHGIGESAAGRTVLEFIPLGMEHMLLGWDHLVFIAGVLLLSDGLRTAAKLITLFVAGHSLTLLVATLAGWQIDATLVDVVIALSLVYVGIEGLSEKQKADWRRIGAIVFAFGLVHGLGLSTRLQDLDIPEDNLLWRVLSFNLGVEIGQLSALALFVAIGIWFDAHSRDDEQRLRVTRAGFFTVLAAGLIGAAVLSFPGEDQGDSGTAAEGCSEEQTEPPPFVAGAGHPDKNFYSPREDAPEADLDHVIGDGLVVVRYRNDLAEPDVRRLSHIVAAEQFVIAAPDTELAGDLRATTFETTLVCESFNQDELAGFIDDWLAQFAS